MNATATSVTSAAALSAPPHARRTGRRVGAVLTGLLTIFALSFGVDAVLHAAGIYPPWGQPMSDELFALAAAYRAVISALGCYVTGRLAPYRPMQHALVLGAVGFVLSAAAAAATWNKGPEFGPRWYPLLLVVIALPCAWVGGKLAERRPPARAEV